MDIDRRPPFLLYKQHGHATIMDFWIIVISLDQAVSNLDLLFHRIGAASTASWLHRPMEAMQEY